MIVHYEIWILSNNAVVVIYRPIEIFLSFDIYILVRKQTGPTPQKIDVRIRFVSKQIRRIQIPKGIPQEIKSTVIKAIFRSFSPGWDHTGGSKIIIEIDVISSSRLGIGIHIGEKLAPFSKRCFRNQRAKDGAVLFQLDSKSFGVGSERLEYVA